MILNLGIFLIFITVLIKMNQSKISKLEINPKLKKLLDIGNIDKIFRFIQYFCMFAVGQNPILTGSSCACIQVLLVNSKQKPLQEVQKLRKLVRNFRKIIKFIRGPKFINNLSNKKFSVPDRTKSASSEIYLLQILKVLEVVIKTIGQICLIIFYFTDHHQSFFQIGLLSSKQYRVQQLGDIGLQFRIYFSVCLIISIILANFRLYRQIQLKIAKQIKKNKKTLIINGFQIVAHVADIIVFHGLINKGFMARRYIGLIGILASIIRLGRIVF